jgi:hypothetical protein
LVARYCKTPLTRSRDNATVFCSFIRTPFLQPLRWGSGETPCNYAAGVTQGKGGVTTGGLI